MKVYFEQKSIPTIEVGEPIGYLRNNWRMRFVTVYDHPTDTSLVVTVGEGFKQGFSCNAVEKREDWTRVISLYPTVAIYD